MHWVTKFLTWWCVFIATYNGSLSHISVADEQQLLVGFRSHLCYFTILQFLASCCFHNSKLELWKAIWKETEIWVQHKSRCISNFDRCRFGLRCVTWTPATVQMCCDRYRVQIFKKVTCIQGQINHFCGRTFRFQQFLK